MDSNLGFIVGHANLLDVLIAFTIEDIEDSNIGDSDFDDSDNEVDELDEANITIADIPLTIYHSCPGDLCRHRDSPLMLAMVKLKK